MHPKKSKELIPIVSKDLGISEKIVEDVTNFYWREVWLLLTNPQDIKVHLENLGDFNIKHWLLDKEIDKIDHIKTDKYPSQVKFIINKKLAERVDILKNLKVLLEEETQRKDFIKEHKKSAYAKEDLAE